MALILVRCNCTSACLVLSSIISKTQSMGLSLRQAQLTILDKFLSSESFAVLLFNC